MLPSLIINLFALLGRGLVWLAYRTEGMRACKILEKDLNPVSSLFGIGLLIWVPCAMMTVMDFTYSIGAVLYSLGYLLVYIIWYFSTRKTAKEMIASVKAYEERSAAEVVASRNNSSTRVTKKMPEKNWHCKCGRENSANTLTCFCGTRKADIPEKSGYAYAPAENAAKVNGWLCECGRINADYVMTCACGITKKEMKLRRLKGENAE